MAKIKVGQRVNLTFDALTDLNISGKVIEIDNVGTVSSGVVSYTVKISLDVQNESIKPNMSVSATIIISSKANVMLVASSAVKTQGGSSYVEVLANGVPERKAVTVGDSNDTQTEITSGLNEGDLVITQTISSQTVSSASSQTSNSSGATNRSFGVSGGADAGAAFRMMR